MPAARLIVEAEPGSGSWNMAVDEVLLESAVNRDVCTLRWYRWNRATLSLGYFQNLPDEADENVPASLRSLPVVRRLSGGGAIVHHHEWTYSCALPAAHPLAGAPQQLFAHVHRRIVDVLRRREFAVQLRGDGPASHAGEPPVPTATETGETPILRNAPFLCFSRADANDVLLDGYKVLGSAQRRRRGAILQHGSLLLRASSYAPHLPGILDLVAELAGTQDLLEELSIRTGQLLGTEPLPATLSEEERAQADELRRERYRTGHSESGSEGRRFRPANRTAAPDR